MKIVGVPVTTRNISKLRDGMVAPWARMHHRHPPDNAIALGLDRDQAAPGSRLFETVNVAQQAREIEHERLGVLAQHRKPRHRKRLVESLK